MTAPRDRERRAPLARDAARSWSRVALAKGAARTRAGADTLASEAPLQGTRPGGSEDTSSRATSAPLQQARDPGDPAAPCRERRRSSGMVRRRAPSPEPSASGAFASIGPGASAACSPCAGPFARSTYREPGTSTPSCARSPPRRANQTRTLRGMECRSSIPHASLAPEGIRRVAPAGRLGRRDRPACETRGRAP